MTRLPFPTIPPGCSPWRTSECYGTISRQLLTSSSTAQHIFCTKLTNNALSTAIFAHGTLNLLWFFRCRTVAVPNTNFRRLLRTVEALSDLGPEMTAEREFSQTARTMLAALRESSGAREAALFTFSDKPSLLTSIAAEGFALLPEPALIPLLPRHVPALAAARGPVVLNETTYDVFFSSNGNVAPELFK